MQKEVGSLDFMKCFYLNDLHQQIRCVSPKKFNQQFKEELK